LAALSLGFTFATTLGPVVAAVMIALGAGILVGLLIPCKYVQLVSNAITDISESYGGSVGFVANLMIALKKLADVLSPDC